jgi:hypothetical protein
MRPRSVGQLLWLTGLGPPAVLPHAGGPPFETDSRDRQRDTSFDLTVIGDAHRVPVESLDREGMENPPSGLVSSISCTSQNDAHALTKSARNQLW